MKKIGVIGAGAWGTGISNLLAKNGHQVFLWCFEQEVVDSINERNVNETFLPQVELRKNIKAVESFAVFSEIEAIFVVTPTQYTANIIAPLKKVINDKTPLVICSKGIVNDSLQILSDILQDMFSNPLAVMSGPNFADEVASGLPAITTIACANQEIGKFLCDIVENPEFTPSFCDDIIGAQLGGAIKNIIAIGLGIAEGKGFSQSSKAAIMNKGLKEIAILTQALGGKVETALEPCIMGDLVLTCSSLKSRNMSLGFALGEGKSVLEIMQGKKTLAEGALTVKAAVKIAQNLGLELPLIKYINDILYKEAEIKLERLI